MKCKVPDQKSDNRRTLEQEIAQFEKENALYLYSAAPRGMEDVNKRQELADMKEKLSKLPKVKLSALGEIVGFVCDSESKTWAIVRVGTHLREYPLEDLEIILDE